MLRRPARVGRRKDRLLKALTVGQHVALVVHFDDGFEHVIPHWRGEHAHHHAWHHQVLGWDKAHFNQRIHQRIGPVEVDRHSAFGTWHAGDCLEIGPVKGHGTCCRGLSPDSGDAQVFDGHFVNLHRGWACHLGQCGKVQQVHAVGAQARQIERDVRRVAGQLTCGIKQVPDRIRHRDAGE